MKLGQTRQAISCAGSNLAVAANVGIMLLRMICSNCSASMPEISGFCPACGRPVSATRDDEAETEKVVPGVAPLSPDAWLGAIAYFPIVPPITFLLLPALSRKIYLRFHSWQSLMLLVSTVVIAGLTRLAFSVLSILSSFGFLLAWLLAGLVSLAIVFLWIAIVIKALLGDAYELPFIGIWSARLS